VNRIRKLRQIGDTSKPPPRFFSVSRLSPVARLPSVRMLSAVRRLYAGPALGLFLRPHTPQKRSLDEGSPECNLVTDYRTFIEDFQRLVRFVDYLNVLKL
jgi:hypothetical protein